MADALKVSPSVVAEWVGRARSVQKRYIPPAGANLLDQDERDALDRLIRLFVKSKIRSSPGQ